MDWFSLVDPIAWMHPIVLQTPTPEVKVSPDVELLKSQLEFLKADHARLAADFVERMKQLTAQSDSVSKDVETYLSRMFALTTFATTVAAGFVGWFGLQTRKGFNNPRFCKNLTELRRNTGDLVVMDFEHWRPDGQARLVEMADKEERAKAAIEELIKTLPSGTILLVYVNGFIKCLNDFPKSQVVMSNSEVALIGNLVDTAYVSKNRN